MSAGCAVEEEALIRRVVELADRVRRAPEIGTGLSVRATEEDCVYLEPPLMESAQEQYLPEVLKSSFCGRFSGRWDDGTTDAGAVWAVLQQGIRERNK